MGTYRDETVHLRKYLTGIVGNAPFGIITLSSKNEVGIINADAVNFLGFPSSTPDNLLDLYYKNIFINLPSFFDVYEDLLSRKNESVANIDGVNVVNKTLNIKIRKLFNGCLVILEDVSKQADLEKRLRYQASHDFLTRLSNRQEFEVKGEKIVKKAIAHGLPGVIIFIDVDRFKPVNDTAGHEAGDELLIRISSILLSKIRGRDILARIGGDEFAVLLEDCSIEVAKAIAESMREAVESYVFVYSSFSFKVGISAGLAIFGRHPDKLSTVVNAADNACQIAKRQGRNRVHISDSDRVEYEKHKEQADWLPRINEALECGRFVLFAQEILRIDGVKDDKHYELLIRLKNQDGGYESPGAFIPPAERYDLMSQIDRWVIKNAFESICDYEGVYSINLSGQSIVEEDLAGYIESLQFEYRVDPKKVIFEITETAAIHNIDACNALMSHLRSRGYRFSLDDFGSGLSSFSYLKNMCVDFLKIDGSLVKDIAEDQASYAMVKSINEVGHALGLKTIAEFVENADVLKKLVTMGVDYAQGYHIHKPEHANSFLAHDAALILYKAV
ncbi:hypothetical protein A9Q99_12995 [Gammaproteobacteria bacterium 45_16_T64]|nr:hypothetical protein A9Q99_12995 [Gammaproteobacteria bacterium 45_16_T64]